MLHPPAGGVPPQPQSDLLHSLLAPLGHNVHRPRLHHLAVTELAVEAGEEVGVDVGDLLPGELSLLVDLAVQEAFQQPLTLPLPGQTWRCREVKNKLFLVYKCVRVFS